VLRRTLFLALLAFLAVPAGATATRTAPGDGTLSIRDGQGTIQIELRGAIIGHMGSGTLRVDNPKDDDCASPLVWGAETQTPEPVIVTGELGIKQTRCIYGGRDVRFRLAGGEHEISIVRGRDVAISAAGKGEAFLRGTGGLDDGFYSLDAREYVSMPDLGRWLNVGTYIVPAAGTRP
jgi:hypothetical protein